MKKVILLILSAVLLVYSAAGCSVRRSDEEQAISEDKINIVCTTFPQYDWVKNIVGDMAENFNITLLISNGVDVHSYQPSAKDIITISSCDLLIYIGGISDEWVCDVISDPVNKNLAAASLIDMLGADVKDEELAEGMQPEDDEDEHSHASENSFGEELREIDEHIWLSLKNAQKLCACLTEKIVSLDEENKSVYEANSRKYIEELSALDKRFEELVNNSPSKTLVFADRFPFRYFVDDYGIDYYAAFPGCSAEEEASFETVIFLSGKVDELALDTVFTLENSNQRIAKAVIENTRDKNQRIVTMNSMQSVSDEQIKKGVSYLGMMEDNYNSVSTAMSR